MAWRSCGTTNSELVENMKRNGLINNNETYEAMMKVDRAHFAPSSAYKDAPQTIGYGATISAPHMHSHACEEIIEYLKPGASILDVGSGSGYLVAVMAHMVQPGGRIVGIEHIQELVDLSLANLRKDPQHSAWLDDGTITIIKGDGRLGYAAKAPYNAIHVGAAAREVHKDLVEQLATPGRLFIPVESHGGYGDQSIWHVDKDKDGNVRKEQKSGGQIHWQTAQPKYVTLCNTTTRPASPRPPQQITRFSPFTRKKTETKTKNTTDGFVHTVLWKISLSLTRPSHASLSLNSESTLV
ncbi:hypothetical protein H072_571 [Dactylellina haptotyla CBS 200.50]|uniref:Protein-L-isoaspartate O-methyltransferase n=1 Tax=Dactylellina haptotyla (strain CBS 200.50) TaxID=1284197 RepID=S8C119_DACHA|nr:hypothetical protein H072_571 [Dactylellina haptotyla CBS 200.50]